MSRVDWIIDIGGRYCKAIKIDYFNEKYPILFHKVSNSDSFMYIFIILQCF